MPSLRTTNGIFLIVALAALGFLLVYIPPKLIEQYDRVQQLGPMATYVYFGLVGTGAVLLLGIAGTIAWRLWRATRKKEQRRERGAKDPSRLSADEKEKEVADNLAAVDDLTSQTALSDDLKRELQALVN